MGLVGDRGSSDRTEQMTGLNPYRPNIYVRTSTCFLTRQPPFALWLRTSVSSVLSKPMKRKYTGKCLCGEVTYVAYGQPIVVAQCHCEQCRRLSGTGHTVGAMFVSDAVAVSGKLSEFKYSSDKGSEVTKLFCANCGSPIYGKNTRIPGHLPLTLGTMDDASELSVEVVIFERDKRHWDQLGRDVVSFATQPDWKPED